MVNSKLSKCCPGCGTGDLCNWILDTKKPRKRKIVKEPIKIEPIPPTRNASKPNYFEMLSMLHELKTGQSGRKSAGGFFMNQSGMPALKKAWPQIDDKMKAKEKQIATACDSTDED